MVEHQYLFTLMLLTKWSASLVSIKVYFVGMSYMYVL